MLETIREFGLERLMASGEESAIRAEHAAYCLELVENSTPRTRWPTPPSLLRVFDVECDNLRAALAWMDHVGDVERYLRLTTSLWALWHTLGHIAEGRRSLERGLARGGGTPAVLRGRALPVISASLALLRSVDDRLEAAWTLNMLGIVLKELGRYDQAEACLEESLTTFRDLGSEANVSHTLCYLGVVAFGRGDLERAKAYCQEALDRARAAGNAIYVALALHILALVSCEDGDHTGAGAALVESFAQGQAAEDRLGLSVRIAIAAVLAVGRGLHESAAHLLGAAETLSLAFGTPFALPERIAYERAATAARVALGEDRFASAWAVGRALSAEAAVAQAKAFLAAPVSAPMAIAPTGLAMDHGLTPRELEVLRLLVEGRSDPEIAAVLFVSRRIAATHVANTYRKLGVSSRAEAAAYAVRHGLA